MFSTDGILGRNHAIAAAALDGLAMRQQVHAENLANVDTKGYRARTVDFESVLGAAVNGKDPGIRFNNPLAGASSVLDARHGGAISNAFSISDRKGDAGVDKSTEVGRMMNDNIRFRVLTQSVTNQISSMRSVISEMGRG